MTKEKRNIIDNLTSKIIKYYNIDVRNFDIENFVKEIGGDIQKVDTIKFLYANNRVIKTSNDSFIIIVDKYQSAENQKFVIAHELGHLFLHMGYQIDEEKWKKVKIM